MARLAEMEEKATAEEEQKIYEESMERKRKESEERTRKLAEKRRRRRLAKKQRRGHGEVFSSNGRDEDGSMDEEDKDLSETTGKKQCVSENTLCMPIVQIKDDGNFMQMMLALEKDRRGGQTRNT
ncbi:Protein of unknown function DUF1168 [Nannochloropsis gaditana]|uniref:Uncharacterized protein n=1 Tax=Nannochloropsis gaditana TaxID=72520 RepID=W7TR68_9STRA|nr:Protein of unknown function DUF1168 [Nannochloropsis gaditana]